MLGLAGIGLLIALVASQETPEIGIDLLDTWVQDASRSSISSVALVVVAVFLLKSGASVVIIRQMAYFLAHIEASKASQIAEYVFEGQLYRVRRLSKSGTQFAVNRSVSAAFSGLLLPGSAILAESVLATIVIVGFTIINIYAAVAISIYVGATLIVFQLMVGGKLRAIGEKVRHASISSQQAIFDLTDLFREAAATNQTGFFLERFRVSRGSMSTELARLQFLMGVPRYIVESALVLGVVGMLVWQSRQADFGSGLWQLGLFLGGGLRIMGAILPIQSAVASIKSSSPAAQSAQLLLTEMNDSTRKASPAPALSPQGSEPRPQESAKEGAEVSVRNVTFQFSDSNHSALRALSFSLKPGTFAAIIGPSGAGKSTLADLLTGMYVPNSGQILIDGYQPQHIRTRVPGSLAYVPQKPLLIPGSLRQNLALSHTNLLEDSEILDVINLVGLTPLVSKMPRGIDEFLGDQADSLSGGEVQRIGLARALLAKPRLLVLDEVTSSLDSRTSERITNLVVGLKGTTTRIVIAHELATVRAADVVLVLEEGSIVDRGTFEELSLRNNHVRSYLGRLQQPMTLPEESD